METALPLTAVIIALAGFAWGVLQLRSNDLRLIEDRRREDGEALERRLKRTEADLAECREARREIEAEHKRVLRENVELMRQLVQRIDMKLNGGT